MPTIDRNARSPVSFYLNGAEVDGYAENRLLLSDFLRHEVGATGTHVGCEHGICGACTVLVDGLPIRACLMLAVQAHGREIQTIEGLANDDGSFSALQAAFNQRFAAQCGYCTPGILMTLKFLQDQNRTFSEDDIRDALGGHICRCTGYREIVDAALDVLGHPMEDTGADITGS